MRSLSASRTRAAATLIAAGLSLAGCESADKVVGRYATASCRTDGGADQPCESVMPNASASAVSIATPSGSTKVSATKLPERALAAYVEALAAGNRSPTAEALRTNLSAPLGGSGAARQVDYRVLHRTLIITVHKDGPFNPADRLQETDVSLTLPAGSRFEAWDTAATVYSTINAGSIELTQTRDTSQELSLGAPSTAPLSASLTAKASQENSRKETFAASSQVELLTVSVENGGRTLRVRRQGGIGVDLTGNTVVQVDIAVGGEDAKTVYAVPEGYTAKGGALLAPDKVGFAAKYLQLPPKGGLDADVQLRYTLRHVTAGGGTLEEKDDTVLLWTRSARMPAVRLVPQRDMIPQTFGLASAAGAFLAIAVPGADPRTLCFEEVLEASDLLVYLRLRRPPNGAIGGAQLGPPVPGGVGRLQPRDIDGLQVRACP
jgi:hypothetical protein